MDEYKNYLAASILSEERVVTYRLLSRELKVHVNTAKQMLFEFHRIQNGKKPGTVHAIYLVSGTKRKEEDSTATNGIVRKDGEDENMQSSPFMPSSAPQGEEGTGETSILSISLTGEENLDDLRTQYETITSIHIYSLGPHPLKDLQVLSDITREIQNKCAGEDPLTTNAAYGTIINENVVRREGRPRPPPAAAVPAAKPQLAKSKLDDSKDIPKSFASTSAAKQEPKPQLSSAAKDFFGKGSTSAKTDVSSTAEKKPATLRKESSSIFKSFAKAKPKLKREGTDTSANTSAAPSAAEDEPMKGMSDDGDDDDEEPFVSLPKPASSELVDKDRKSRKDREAALKRMMDDDEEDEEVATPHIEEVEEEMKPTEDPVVDIPAVSGARRRGRRRVMKKKTIKDEEGYLVTKEEPVWESFSEDEPVAPKPKPQTSSSTTSKPKKPAVKGQGNIMSFFGKK